MHVSWDTQVTNSPHKVPPIEEEGKTRANVGERVFGISPRQCPGVEVAQAGSGESVKYTRSDWPGKISQKLTITDKEEGASKAEGE